MKVISIVLVAMFLLCSVVMAATPVTNITEVVDRDNPLGIGLDLEYDINDYCAAAIEIRYDLENDEMGAFLVGKIKLNALIKKSE